MKLAAAALAAVSLMGCATENDGEGGAFLAGMRPAKPQSIDDVVRPIAVANTEAIEQLINGGLSAGDVRWVVDTAGGDLSSTDFLKPPFPINDICQMCSADSLLIRPQRYVNPNDLMVLDVGNKFFCRIWVTDSGHIETTDCQ